MTGHYIEIMQQPCNAAKELNKYVRFVTYAMELKAAIQDKVLALLKENVDSYCDQLVAYARDAVACVLTQERNPPLGNISRRLKYIFQLLQFSEGKIDVNTKARMEILHLAIWIFSDLLVK